MTKTEYLKFEDSTIHPKGKTRVVNVYAVRGGAYLGRISWYSRWRQYTFRPHALTIWNSACLNRIEEELVKMNNEHREKLRERQTQ